MQEAVIAVSVRTPIGRAQRGGLKDTRPDDLAGLVIQEAITRVPSLDPEDVEDVILGCAIPVPSVGQRHRGRQSIQHLS